MTVSANAMQVLKKRYLSKDENGNVIEEPEDLFKRVAKHIAKAEDEPNQQKMEEIFTKMMQNGEFLPNSPTLMNAGRDLNQLAACFVLPIEDSMSEIFDALKNSALIFKSGGGVGYSFSNLRPKDSNVGSTGGVASGPVSFMKIFNESTEQIKQGGCLVPDTLVNTDTGLMYLSEICDTKNEGWKKHNIKVATDEGFKTSAESFNNGISKVIKITTKDGYEIIGTPDHKIKVHKNNKLDWCKLKDITPSDFLYIKLDQHIGVDPTLDTDIVIEHLNQNDCILPNKLTDDFAFWLGYIFGNGFVDSNENSYRFGASINNSHYLGKDISNLVNTIFGVNTWEQHKNNDNSTSYMSTNKKVKTFLQKNKILKHKSLTCSIPKLIRQSNQNIISHFLRGLFEADGTIVHNYPSLSTASEKLAKEVGVLLRGIGIPNKISKSTHTKDRFSTNPIYTILIETYIGLKNYIEKIGFDKRSRFAVLNLENIDLSREKNFILPNYKDIIQPVIDGITKEFSTKRPRAKGLKFFSTNPKLRKSLLRYLRGDRNFTFSSYLYYKKQYPEFAKFAPIIDPTDYYDEVKNIIIEDIETLTLDLSVEENHTYLANGFVTHNTRRGASMAVLRVNHPDILEFITCKSDGRTLNNFNISVAVTDEFMKCIEENSDYWLKDPRNKQPVKKISAREVYTKLIESAWETGDPGILFIDEINRRNPTPQLGSIDSVNPCGETPLLKMECCILGSLNLAKFISKNQIDYPKLKIAVWNAVRFLDNTIIVTTYPLPEIKQMMLGNRKIGLGVMGFSDLLFQLGIPYNSDQGVDTAKAIMSFIQMEGHKASEQLAKERGAFPNFTGTTLGNTIRNATVTTIAPTGTLSIIANCSSGIEPLFALSFTRTVMDNDKLIEINPYFKQVAIENGFYSVKLMEEVSKTGSIQHINNIPDKIKRVFVTSHDISPEWHVKMQAAFQRYTDNAVSKTVNLPSNATVEDVRNVYNLAYQLGCKGVTVYRDGSKTGQVLSFRTTEKDSQIVSIKDRPDTLEGFTTRIMTGLGALYVTVSEHEGKPFEVFATIGKSGRSATAKTEAIGRLVSLALRSGVDVSKIIEQLKGIGGEHPVFQKDGLILSVPDAISRVLEERYGKGEKTKTYSIASEKCPECGAPINFEEGCKTCHSCGYSKCS